MKKRMIAICCIIALTAALALSGCGTSGGGETTGGAAPAGEAVNVHSAEDAGTDNAAELKDGVYVVDVDTDSSMFHINEAKDGKGELIVEDGKMMLHITLASKNIVNMFKGTAEEAEAAAEAGQALIEPVLDTVTYDDGITEEVYGFIIPVDSIEETITVAIIGTHGNWYTHTVTVTNPVPAE